MKNDLSAVIPVNLYTSFFFQDKLFTGVVKTLSSESMFISTSMDFPCDSSFELHIPFKEEILSVPVRVRRFIRNNDRYNGVDVEVIGPDKKYLEFVARLRSITS